ncbi:MFS transporter [Promethearchaeum syntrophicum]|uniref:MFS transporter n=1 Tax=Promethearchaeum syntrophicum TaxID=2594042 RepID=A0A5B9DAW0_9ARCH|nr:MFS transporter [Candidatus Prometheoarchaeum syntrophicum]
MNEELKSNKNVLQRIFLGLSSFQILAMFRRGLFYTYLSLYLRFFLNLSVTATTLFATIPMILSVVAQNFVWGPLTDKIQKRRIFIVIGELSAGIGIVIVYFVHNTFADLQLAGYFVIIGLSIIEFFWSMSNIAWSALVSDIFSPKKRSKAMGRLTSLGGIGQIVGVLIGGVFYDGYGLKYDGYGFKEGPLFFIAAAIMITSIIPILFLVPEGGAKRSWNNPEIKNNFSSGESTNSPEFSYVVFLSYIAALFIINVGRNSIAIPFSQYLVLESGFAVDPLTLGFISNTRGIAIILIGFIAGKLTNKVGLRKTLVISSFFAVIYLIIIALTTSLGLMYVGRFIWGAAEVLIMTSSYALASLLIPQEKRGRLFGVYNATFFLSWGIGSTFVIGPLIDRLIADGIPENNAYKFAFLISAIITLGGLIMLFFAIFIERKRGKNNGDQKKNIPKKLQD